MVKKMETRYLVSAILDDLHDSKMVFIGGPRQVGKTTVAKAIAHDHFSHPLYLNWDRFSDQKQILSNSWPAHTDVAVLDEIHKYPKWKTYLKGEYDVHKDRFRFIVTGSARLNVYRKGGDLVLFTKDGKISALNGCSKKIFEI